MEKAPEPAVRLDAFRFLIEAIATAEAPASAKNFRRVSVLFLLLDIIKSPFAQR